MQDRKGQRQLGKGWERRWDCEEFLCWCLLVEGNSSQLELWSPYNRIHQRRIGWHWERIWCSTLVMIQKPVNNKHCQNHNNDDKIRCRNIQKWGEALPKSRKRDREARLMLPLWWSNGEKMNRLYVRGKPPLLAFKPSCARCGSHWQMHDVDQCKQEIWCHPSISFNMHVSKLAQH